MKIVLPFLLLITCFRANGQNPILDIFPVKDGFINYNGVVEVDTSNKATDLYVAAKSWAIDAFKSSKEVIQEDDKDLHIVILKAYIPITDQKRYWFTLKIETKDGRYRYSLYDINYEGEGSYMGTTAHVTSSLEENISKSSQNKKFIEYYQEIDATFKGIINSLEDSMRKAKKDDW